MSGETLLDAALRASSAVVSIVGERIFADVIPHDVGLPGIAYFRTDTEFVQTIHGATPDGSTASLSIACVAKTRDEADALAVVALAAVGPAGFAVVGQQGSFDLEAELYAAVLNVIHNA